jgi:hypothetical protein
MILTGNYQVDDGDAVRPEEAPQEEEEDGKPSIQSSEWQQAS